MHFKQFVLILYQLLMIVNLFAKFIFYRYKIVYKQYLYNYLIDFISFHLLKALEMQMAKILLKFFKISSSVKYKYLFNPNPDLMFTT